MTGPRYVSQMGQKGNSAQPVIEGEWRVKGERRYRIAPTRAALAHNLLTLAGQGIEAALPFAVSVGAVIAYRLLTQ